MKKKLLTLSIPIISTLSTYAQCAMCKATASSDLQSGGSIAKGLNSGILYLMAVPYLILMIGGYFFFKKPIDEKIKALKNKYFAPKKV